MDFRAGEKKLFRNPPGKVVQEKPSKKRLDE